jgi:hypothetical protein|tara:strand:- start:3947 stop:4243 length:297 start_codon:yes stop_codon:yes gene_type:complete
MPKLIVDNDMSQNTLTVTDVFLITKEFRTSADFSQHIEKNARKTHTGYIDVLVDYCLKQEIEIESIKKCLTTSLKEKIKVEAEALNLLKGDKTGTLPL